MVLDVLTRLLRHASTWSRPFRRPGWAPDTADAVLIALVAEYRAKDRAIEILLAHDSRDTDEIPDFAPLADRRAELLALIVETPARGVDGLVSKAHAARLRRFEVAYDSVAKLGWSLAGDVQRLFDDTA